MVAPSYTQRAWGMVSICRAVPRPLFLYIWLPGTTVQKGDLLGLYSSLARLVGGPGGEA